jgi:hypothetical protein
VRLPHIRKRKAHAAQKMTCNATVGADGSFTQHATCNEATAHHHTTATTTSPFNACGSYCAGMVTPAVLHQAYSIPTVTSVSAGNAAAVAEFQGQYYDHRDINNFNTICRTSVTVDVTIGGNKQVCSRQACGESLLDNEYLGALVHPIPLTTIYSTTYSLMDWIDTVISQPHPQWVQSLSYGNDEAQQVSTAYMQQVNTQFQKAGLMGISIIVASGD